MSVFRRIWSAMFGANTSLSAPRSGGGVSPSFPVAPARTRTGSRSKSSTSSTRRSHDSYAGGYDFSSDSGDSCGGGGDGGGCD